MLCLIAACGGGGGGGDDGPTVGDLLVDVSDVALPGGVTRFDYQDIDAGKNQLVAAHMNDAAV